MVKARSLASSGIANAIAPFVFSATRHAQKYASTIAAAHRTTLQPYCIGGQRPEQSIVRVLT
jgi:hypothetical protein